MSSLPVKKQNNCEKKSEPVRALRIANVVRMLRVPLGEIAKKGIER